MPAACSPVFRAVFTEAASNPSSRRLDGKASVPVTRIACLRCTQRFSTMRSTCCSVIGSPSLAHPMLTLRISDRHVRVIASIRRSGPLVCPMLAARANHLQLPCPRKTEAVFGVRDNRSGAKKSARSALERPSMRPLYSKGAA